MFLDPNSFDKSKLFGLDYFREWAHEIASNYLGNGIPPTDSLCKIAQERGFVPHQVETLAYETNKLIHQKKYASAKDKYHAADFPLADPKEALKRLQTDGGEVKVAVSLPEPKFSRPEDSVDTFYEMFGVKPETIDKTASVKHELNYATEKTAMLNQKINDKHILTKIAAESAELTFIKQARQHVLGGDNFNSRFVALGEVDHFCKHAGAGQDYKKPLAKLAFALGEEGLIERTMSKKAMKYFMDKKADQKAPEEWISPNLKSRIVNGNHPLYITLKTFNDYNRCLDIYKERHQLVDDRLRVMKQKVRAL